ncbi:MAG: hypothetical protein Q9219_003823 [cf. Caloplaca sp. 3 TL-2023]
MPQTPMSEGLRTGQTEWMPPLPIIEEEQPLAEVIRDISQYFVDAIEAPYTFEQLRTASVGHILKPLVKIVKSHFSNVEHDDRGVFETRGFACEIVAWRFLSHLSRHELIDYLLRELPPTTTLSESSSVDEETPFDRPKSARTASNDELTERSRLLYEGRRIPNKYPTVNEPHGPDRSHSWNSQFSDLTDDDPTLSFVGLNALEIATVAGAKRFLSQRVVQDVIDGIWSGDIIFWETLSTHTRKRAQIYHQKKADPYCRLRVPKYQKAFEAAFFAVFLALYYAVLVERCPRYITIVELMLYVWISAFAYDEFGEFKDAGTLFYAADFWSLWDVGIVGIGAVYLVMSKLQHTLPVAVNVISFLGEYSAAWSSIILDESSLGSDELSDNLHHARSGYFQGQRDLVDDGERLLRSASRAILFDGPPANAAVQDPVRLDL